MLATLHSHTGFFSGEWKVYILPPASYFPSPVFQNSPPSKCYIFVDTEEVECDLPTEGIQIENRYRMSTGDQIDMKRNVVYGVSTEGDQIEMKRNVVYGVPTGDQIEMKRNVVYGVSTGGDQIEMKRNVVYGVSTGGDQIEMKRNVVYGVSTGDQIEMKRNVVYGVSTEGDHIEMKRNVVYGVSTEGREGSIGGAGGAVAPPTEMVGGHCPPN